MLGARGHRVGGRSRERVTMRRLLVSVSVVAVSALALTSAAVAAKPVGSCPAAASGFVQVDRDAWWDRTVEGFENEGITVYEDGSFTEEFDQFMMQFGFAGGAALEDFVRGAQWDAIDLNRDGFVCMKDRPNTPGNPDFFLTGVDNTASALRRD